MRGVSHRGRAADMGKDGNMGRACPSCGFVNPDGNRFCAECGSPLGAVAVDDATVDGMTVTGGGASPSIPPSPAPPATPVAGPPMVPPAPPFSAARPVSARPAPMGTPVPVVPSQSQVGALATTIQSTPARGPRSGMASIGPMIIVALAFGALFAITSLIEHLTGTDTSPDSSQTSSQQASSSTPDYYGDGYWPDTEGQAMLCDDEPDMKVVSVDSVGNDLVVTILVTPAASCGSGTTSAISDDATQVTLRDSSGDVVADAVFDLSDSAATVPSDGVKVKLSYAPTQFYRPATELEQQFKQDPSELIIRYIYAATTGAGASTSTGPSSQSGTVGGESASDDESEENARKALDWQVQHDKAAAGAFMSTYTTQLSSKRKDMVIESKTWSYRDILAHFITLRDKHPNVLLIWSGDWPTYDGNSTKYYVIISGESFATIDDAWAWCSANGYTQVDCLPVNLS